MPLLDFNRVRDLIPMSSVLHLMHYPAVPTHGGQAYGPCPLGCSPRPRCASLHLGRKIYNCHRCKCSGNHLDLYATWRRLPLYQAVVELLRELHVPTAEVVADQRRGHS